jgi:hypothetical protein
MTTDDAALDAGSFSAWLADTEAVLRGEQDAVVPCAGCTACCRSSQFVHVGPDEVDALAHIPAPLLFPAPRLPAGHRVLGYDARGACPMLVDDRCSIYEHRPRACRSYDCRVFPAAGVDADAGDATKVEIGARARRWRFDLSTSGDRQRHTEVRSAAAHVQEAGVPPAGDPPVNPLQVALVAIRLRQELDGDREARSVGPGHDQGKRSVSADPGST